MFLPTPKRSPVPCNSHEFLPEIRNPVVLQPERNSVTFSRLASDIYCGEEDKLEPLKVEQAELTTIWVGYGISPDD
jgi:hypothetical protein